MKLDSKYFDMIRIQSRRAGPRNEAPEPGTMACQWKGCTAPARHRAPMGRGRDGEHYWFCREHVRQYNASYNYFDGMSDREVEDFRKDAVYGHRPTWKIAENAQSDGGRETKEDGSKPASEEFGSSSAQSFYAWRARQARSKAKKTSRKLKPLEKKSLAALGLEAYPGKAEVKSRFKELVKRHHPDSNGGDRATEEKLREIIQAYNYLKQVGLV